MHRTRTRALLCCETVGHRVRVRAGDRGIRPTGSVALVRSTALSGRRQRSPRVAAGRACSPASAVSAVSRSAASVRFTPARAATLSPRRAPLWPALPPPIPQRRPARCCMRPPPAPGAAARALVEMPHDTPSTSLATNRADRRRRQGLRRPRAALTPSPIGACDVV